MQISALKPVAIASFSHIRAAHRPRFLSAMSHSGTLSAPEPGDINVGTAERIISALGGAALFGCGLKQRSGATPFLLLAGGLLAVRGITGHCDAYKKLNMNTAVPSETYGVPDHVGFHIEKSIEIKRSPGQVYSYWRQLKNLPRFMPHLKSVVETGPRTSHWVVKGPAGKSVSWDAEIINEHPGEMIAWQTLPGAQVQSAGTVRFESLNDGRNTRVTVNLKYSPPARSLGAITARIFGRAPEQQLHFDLAHFKHLLETDSDTGEA